MVEKNEAPAGVIQTRWVELCVALFIVAVGVLVIYDSHRVGASWGDDGPKSGYFPNIIGWILTAAGAWVAGETVFRWKRLASQVFVTHADFKPVLTMLLPTIGYVILIRFIGIYVASAIYIAGFMIFQGKYKWPIALAVAVGVPLAIFALFEIWFLVPLPKGPLEHILGY
jgi:putative tricarboxylic transport membrane protein